jgi:DNA-binding beta-propeller fold protein YncE
MTIRSPATRLVVVIGCAWLLVGYGRSAEASGLAARSGGPPTVGEVTTLPVGGLTDVAYGYGSLWVPGNGAVRRVDPTTGRVLAEIGVRGDSDLRQVAVGAGAVWIIDSGTERLTRIDPRSDRVTATVALSVSPTGVTVARRWVWITYVSSTATGVAVIDARTRHVGRPIRVRDQRAHVVLLAKGDGHVWVSDALARSPDRAVVEHDDGHDHLTAAFTVAGQDWSYLNAAGDRALWFIGNDTLVRVGTQGFARPHFVPPVRVLPFPQARQVVATNRAVWVLTNRNDVTGKRPGQLWELDPTTLTPARPPITVGTTPVRLFVTPTAVWVANYTDASITKVALQPR